MPARRFSLDPTVAARGTRVVLRRPVPDDRAEFLALARASRAFLAPWEPRHGDPSGELRFTKMLEAWEEGSSLKYLVCDAREGTIVGVFHVNNVVRGVFQCAALGYWTGPAHAGKGYMTEALDLGLRHAFTELGLHRVEINCLPRNAASRALAKRAGFRLEGVSPRYLKIAGRWQDHERWALLAEEWAARRKARSRRKG